MAVYINGEQVNGCTNYASAVSCVDKDGNQSTVQAEIDGLNESVSKQNKNLVADDGTKFRFATDGEGNYGYLKADDSFVPFKGGLFEHEIAFFGWGRYIPRVIAKSDGTFISKIVDNNDAVDISGDYIKITRNYVNQFIALKTGKYNILAPNSQIEVKECEAGEIIKEFPYSNFAGCFVWI